MQDDDDKKTTARYSSRWWINQIDDFIKVSKDYYVKDGEEAIRRYLDIREDDPFNTEHSRRYNMFWANTQILKSALYAVPPKPAVSRENADARDDVARVAALMLERILQQGMTKSNSDAHSAFKRAVEDRLLPGLGQVWHRLNVKTQEMEVEGPLGPVVMTTTDKKACTDYVNWRDFLFSPARCWDEVWWAGRRVWMKRNRFLKRFGKGADVLWKAIKDYAVNEEDHGLSPKGFQKGRAEVFEIWCEDTKKVYFVARGLDQHIERIDDPLGLEDFWPCPPPLLATHSNESLFPRADFTMVRDQYDELDTLNSRISVLTKALRVVGAYDKDNTELAQMMTGPEMAMVPVANWAMLSENGGMTKSVEWFPVEQVANVLKELIPMRAAVVAQIYELTSISDIMRGASNPRETAKAQQLKAQYSSVRLQLTQQDVATFVQNALRIRAEIICKHYEPSDIIEQSQIDQTETFAPAQTPQQPPMPGQPPQQGVQPMQPPSEQLIIQAVKLLKNYEQAEYRIDVSEESLSMSDYTAEREMRIELITAIGQFLSQSAQLVQGNPGSLPYMLRIVQWVVASFRGSKDIESLLDQAVDAAQSAPPPGQEQQKPDHSVEVAQIKSQTDLQVAQLKATTDKEIEQMRLGANSELKREELAEKALQEDLNRVAEEERLAAEQARTAEEAAATRQQENDTMEPVHQSIAEVTARLEGMEEGQEEIKELLTMLIKTVSQTRRRIPRRDANGDIIAVDEEIIKE